MQYKVPGCPKPGLRLQYIKNQIKQKVNNINVEDLF